MLERTTKRFDKKNTKHSTVKKFALIKLNWNENWPEKKTKNYNKFTPPINQIGTINWKQLELPLSVLGVINVKLN